MLDGDVDVRQHLRRVANGGDELVGHALGLKVQHAEPGAIGTHNLRKAHEEAREGVLRAQVLAPDSRVLADEDELANTLLCQGLDLALDLTVRARRIAAANGGDRAERAESVAAVRDLDVGAGALNRAQRGGKRTSGRTVRTGNDRRAPEDAVEYAHDAVLLVGADEGGDLGKLVRKVEAVA